MVGEEKLPNCPRVWKATKVVLLQRYDRSAVNRSKREIATGQNLTLTFQGHFLSVGQVGHAGP